MIPLLHMLRIPHRHSTLDNHNRIRIHLQNKLNHLLNMRRIKEIPLAVVVGRRRNHHKIGITISRTAIQGRNQIQRFLRQVFFNIFILNRRLPAVNLVHLLRHDINRHNLVVLCQQSRYGHTHITRSCNSNLHCIKRLVILSFCRCYIPGRLITMGIAPSGKDS